MIMTGLHGAFCAARKAVERLSVDCVGPSGAIDVLQLCARAGIKSVQSKSMLATGLLSRDPKDEWNIFVQEGLSPARRRFTIAHELAHLLLLRAGASPREMYCRDFKARHTAEERCADKLAGELLMPSSRMTEALLAMSSANAGVWEQVHRLARSFEVSVSACVFRLLELQSVVVILARTEAEICDLGRQVSVDCSKHARVLFHAHPNDIFGKICLNSVFRNDVMIDVDIFGKATQFRVASQARKVGSSECKQLWTLGWNWIGCAGGRE